MISTQRHVNYDSPDDIIHEAFLHDPGPFLKGVNQIDQEICRLFLSGK